MMKGYVLPKQNEQKTCRYTRLHKVMKNLRLIVYYNF